MKRLFKSQQKKKAKLRAGRGGVRTSRSWEKRNQERYKRGERREEGEDESKIIGEEIKKDAMGNLQITYRDYEKEARAKAEVDRQKALDILRLDTIRRDDIQLRLDDKAIDRQDNLLRERERLDQQREFRDRDDQFRHFQTQRDDVDSGYNRIFKGRKLDFLEAQMNQGNDFNQALLNLDEKINKRFDAAEERFTNLLSSAQDDSIEISDLTSQHPRVLEVPDVPEERWGPGWLEQGVDVEEGIAVDDNDEDFDLDQPELGFQSSDFKTRGGTPRPETPREAPRQYTEDLKPHKEKRQPIGAERTFDEDLSIIGSVMDIPEKGTPERLQFDNDLGAGNYNAEVEILKKDSRELQGQIEADKKRVEELTSSIEKDKKDVLQQNLEQLRSVNIGNAEGVLPSLNREDFEEILNPLTPLNITPAEQEKLIQSKAKIEGMPLILEEPDDEEELTFDDPLTKSSGHWTTTSEEEEEESKFIPDKYVKNQDVMYFRKRPGQQTKWVPAKIVDYKQDASGEPRVSISRTGGSKAKQQPVETEMDRIIPIPNAGELLNQQALREDMKKGILKPDENRKESKKSAFWEDRDKFIIRNNTSQEWRGIAPKGKSVINYHKENARNYEENTYYHTPLDDKDGWVEQSSGKRVIHPKFLDPAIKSGLLTIEKLEQRQPYKKGTTNPAGVGGGGTAFGFSEPLEPEAEDLE